MTLVGMLDLRKDPRNVFKSYAFAAVAKAEGVGFFYFTPGRVDFEHETIRGLCYEEGEWREKTFPFPEVIHNSKSHAKSSEQQEIIERLRRRIPFTSIPVGNKMYVYDKVTKAGTFAHYMLPTILLVKSNQLWEQLDRNRKIVMKPVNGRKGRDIRFLELVSEDAIQVGEGEHFRTVTKDELMKELDPLIKMKSYMLQPFVGSRTKLYQVYDFRLHVQKDGSGQWVITAAYPRIGPVNSLKSNISSGGATNYLEPFLRQEFGKEDYNIKRYLEQFALQFAKHLDQIYGVSFDDLGIDVCLDDNNKIWVYEVNWHPGVPPVFYLEMDVAVNAIRYAVYLAALNRKGDAAE